MCLAIPGRVKKIEGRKLLIEYPNEEREAHDGGVDVIPGDYVLVQMGIVVKKLLKKEAEEALKGWSSQTL